MNNLSGKFLDLLEPPALIVGVGNLLKGDDAAGIMLMERLKGVITAPFLDCGVAPENYLEKIVSIAPHTVIILDAVDLDQTPGTIRIMKAGEIAQGGISTHSLSLRMFFDYLNTRLEAINIFLLGIQPQSVALGEGLSEKVNTAIDLFVEELKHHKNRPEVTNA